MGLFRIHRIASPGGELRTGEGLPVARRAYVARTALSRLVGMLGTPDPARDEALVLTPCTAVHGVGLRAGIGVAFVDRAGIVLRVVDPLPWSGAACPGAHAVIEAASGVLAVSPGDRLVLTPESVFPHGGHFASTAGGSNPVPGALSDHRGHPAPACDRRTP